MKRLIFCLLLLLSAGVQAQEADVKALDVVNLMVMFREGRQLPEGSVETNTIDVSFTVRNALQADRAKITVTQKGTGEVLEVKTVNFSERDGVAFYSSGVYPRRLHKDAISVQIPIGRLTQNDVEVEVFLLDKKNKATRKLKQ
jgi:hypothetical protein